MIFHALELLPFGIEFQYRLFERLVSAAIETILLFLIVLLIAKVVGTRRPRAMAWLWIIVCLKPMATLLVGPVFEISRIDGSHVVAPLPPRTEEVFYFESENTTDESAAIGNAVPTLSDLPPLTPLEKPESAPVTIVLSLWTAFAITVLLVQSVRRRKISTHIRDKCDSAPIWLRERHAEIASEIGLSRLPRLRVSHFQMSPMVVGALRPTVIMPVWMLKEGDSSDIAWSLRHELTHVRRHDILLGTLAEVSRIVFFWLPPVWFAFSHWHESAELACDSAVANDDSEAVAYAGFLYRLIARTRPGFAGLTSSSMSAARTEVGRRIEAMLRHAGRNGSRSARLATAAVIAFAIMSATIGAGVSLMPPLEQKTVTVEHDSLGTSGDRQITDGAIRVSIRGVVDIDPTSGVIRTIDEGGEIAVSEISGGRQRQLTVNSDPENIIKFEYTVDDNPAEITDATLQWYQTILREYVTNSH